MYIPKICLSISIKTIKHVRLYVSNCKYVCQSDVCLCVYITLCMYVFMCLCLPVCLYLFYLLCYLSVNLFVCIELCGVCLCLSLCVYYCMLVSISVSFCMLAPHIYISKSDFKYDGYCLCVSLRYACVYL